MEIEGYENYLLYDDARVYNKKFNRFLKPGTNQDGYKLVGLWKNGKGKTFRLHRLVGLHYIPNPENKPQVDHIDRDQSNNHVSNLRWATILENHQNKGDMKNNTSGIKNIRFNQQKDLWRYHKTINKITYEKTFKTFEEALDYKTKFETIHNIS